MFGNPEMLRELERRSVRNRTLAFASIDRSTDQDVMKQVIGSDRHTRPLLEKARSARVFWSKFFSR
jgi:hypothetical protein